MIQTTFEEKEELFIQKFLKMPRGNVSRGGPSRIPPT